MDTHIRYTLLEKLKPGDHIASGRLGDSYEHHGIYIGQDDNKVHKVTHFKEDSTISCSIQRQTVVQNCTVCNFKPLKNGGRVTTCLDCFCQGSRIHIVKYQLPLIQDSNSYNNDYELLSHVAVYKKHDSDDDDDDIVVSKFVSSRSPEEVLEVARSDWYIGKYNFMFNNCEDFALYCVTGKERSSTTQGENVLCKLPYMVGKELYLMTDGHMVKEMVKEKVEKVKEKVEKVKEKVKEKAEKVKEKMKEKAEKVKERVKEKVEKVKEKAKDKAEKVKEKMKEKAEKVKQKAENAEEKAKEKAENAEEKVKEKAEKVKEKVRGKVEKAKDKTEKVKEKMKEKAEKMKEKAEKVKQKAEKVKQKAENAEEKAKEKAERVKEKTKEKAEKAKEKAEKIIWYLEN